MVQAWDVTEVEIDGRAFMVRPVGACVLDKGNVVAQALAESLDKPLEWAIGFFFGNTELSLEVWTVISGDIQVWSLGIVTSFHRMLSDGLHDRCQCP